MKLTDKTRWSLCLLAAAVLMVVPFILYITGTPYNPRIMKILEFAMLMVVLYLLVIYPRRPQSRTETEEDGKEDIKEDTKK